MTTYAINRSGATLPVEIDFPNEPTRAKEHIFIQTKSKAIIPALSRVTPEFVALHQKELTIHQIDSLNEPVLGVE